MSGVGTMEILGRLWKIRIFDGGRTQLHHVIHCYTILFLYIMFIILHHVISYVTVTSLIMLLEQMSGRSVSC